MRKAPWLTTRVRAWVLYDVASSVYFGVFPAVLFPVYFQTFLDGGPHADLHWGLTAAGAAVLSGLAAPVAGALADRSACRWSLLVAMTLLCCTATAAVMLVPGGNVIGGALVFIAAHAGYTLAMSLYDSYLPHVARADSAGRVSGLGWGLGFIGGIVAILAVMPLAEAGMEAEPRGAFERSFLVVAVLFLIVAAPALGGLRGVRSPPARSVLTNPFRAAFQTLRRWREEQEVFRFLLAYYLISDALVTIIFFTAVFLRASYGVTIPELLWLALLYHVLALPATVAFGWLADRWSHRKAIALSLGIWGGTVMFMVFGTAPWVPMLVVILLAAVLGSTQALLRSEFSRLIPPERSAEFYGFNALAGRLSAALGPVVFGLISTFSGNQRIALLSILLFLCSGAGLLARAGIPSRAASDHGPTLTEY